jgi:uncharacterized membrane protein YgdD (TMEM256/DUF423 family)
MQRAFLQLSALLALLDVAFGAFARHALENRLSAHMLEVVETAARYQMYHALGLGLVGVLAAYCADKRLKMAGWCFVFGIIVFSGSLYAYALSGMKILGAITPLGGLAFMAGWLLLFLAASSLPSQKASAAGAD